MDDFENLVTPIIDKVIASKLSDTEKADIFAQLTIGMRKLVWPILLVHTPEHLLKKYAVKSELTIEEYTDLIQTALRGPGTANDIYTELKGALEEVDALVTKTLSK